jgi:hypothetical protein
MAPDKKTIWDKISSNGAILIFIVGVIFSAGKYTGNTSEEIKQLRQELRDFKDQQQYNRTQDNLFIKEYINSRNQDNGNQSNKKDKDR